MNVLMFTNTYLPHVGGVARSVATLRDELRRTGHRVVVVAPDYGAAADDEDDVIRMPAIRHFNGSEFSVELPIPGALHAALAGLHPDIVHSHHPFLLGASALRVARLKGVPLAFTFHTMWEHYAHYLWDGSSWLKRFASALAVGYAGLADVVFAPSASVRTYLLEKGVRSPIAVAPTGIDWESWRAGDGARFRWAAGIPQDAPVIGYLGRLALEKNLEFLARCAALFLRKRTDARFLVVGDGPQRPAVRAILEAAGLGGRMHETGALVGAALRDAVRAMDAMVFASKSETQGLVLAEAMAAGVPVVALDAPGSRDIVLDRINGRLVQGENPQAFVEAIEWILERRASRSGALQEQCLATARRYSIERTAERALRIYDRCVRKYAAQAKRPAGTISELRAEWALIQNLASAAAHSGHAASRQHQEAAA